LRYVRAAQERIDELAAPRHAPDHRQHDVVRRINRRCGAVLARHDAHAELFDAADVPRGAIEFCGGLLEQLMPMREPQHAMASWQYLLR
jgi:hypothetical protein